MASLLRPPLTEEEYLRIERQATIKSEFLNGQTLAMVGGSPNHSLLANRIGSLLDLHVPTRCRVCNAGLRIHIPVSGLYTYADCSVICGEMQLSGDQQDNVLNPLLIVEVLSPSTEAYDRGEKFALYRTIVSFQEYLLVHQDRRHIEHYSKQEDGSWLLRDHIGDSAIVDVGRLAVQIKLSDLYAVAMNCE